MFTKEIRIYEIFIELKPTGLIADKIPINEPVWDDRIID